MEITRRELLHSAGLLAGGSLLAADAATKAAVNPPGTSPPILVDLSDYERVASEQMSKMAWSYVTAGAADELTLRWNHEAYERLKLRTLTRLPVLLKGVMNRDDAGRAIDEGVAGLIVSNHGGRNLDTVPATIEVLPEVVARVGGRMPVLVDGGIRRGTDVLKAIALGASAVLIGRPYLYGLAVGGAGGVTRVVNILRREFETAMALTGRTSLAKIDPTVIWR